MSCKFFFITPNDNQLEKRHFTVTKITPYPHQSQSFLLHFTTKNPQKHTTGIIQLHINHDSSKMNGSFIASPFEMKDNTPYPMPCISGYLTLAQLTAPQTKILSPHWFTFPFNRPTQRNEN